MSRSWRTRRTCWAVAVLHRPHRGWCCVGYIDFRFAEIKWRNQHPKLATCHRTSWRGRRCRRTSPWTSHDPSPSRRGCKDHPRDRVCGRSHDPAFLSGHRQGRPRRGAEGQRKLARAEPLRATHGPAGRHNPALGREGGRQRHRDRHRRRQPQAAHNSGADDQLNTLLPGWRRSAPARRCDASGDDRHAHRSRRLEHRQEGRQAGGPPRSALPLSEG